jgi:tripartite motif-containing protein 71
MKMWLSKLIAAVVCVLCVLVAVLAPAAAVSAQEVLPAGGLESSLVPGLGIGGGRQAAEEAAARLSSPEALAEDARSRTAFAGYKRGEAVALARQVFGIATPRWTPPQDQGSGHITSYVGENMAEEVLPDGKHVLVDSSIPLRSAQGSGQLKPVALGLGSTASGYVPSNPLVPVVIGKSAAEGVAFQFGLRMTPTAHAGPEPAEVVGDSVFYPGTAKDTDFMLEPRPMGVEASWQLLSAESPTENSLTFTLPTGAELKLSKSVEGAAEVTLEGQQLVIIPQAFATEADGASLPVSYSVSGSTLTTHADLEGNVDWPVDVDPVVWEKYGGGEYGGPGRFWSDWVPAGTEPERSTKEYGGQGYTEVVAEVLANAPSKSAWGNWSIEAPGYAAGEGAITRVDVTRLLHGEANHSNIEADLIGSNGSPVYSYDAEIPGDTKSGQILTSAALERVQAAFCADGESGGYDGGPKPFCNENYGARDFQIEVQNWEDRPYRQFVAMETATIRYLDTSNIKAEPSSASEIPGTGQPNVLGPGEHWLSKNSGAFEAIGKDPAFGVYKMVISITGEGKTSQIVRNYSSEGGCAENLCGAEEKDPATYASFGSSSPPNGNDAIKIEAGDASGLTAIWSSTVHVDNSSPYNLKITGANVVGKTVNITEGPAGDQVNVEATEGSGSVPSSGIKSLRLQVGPEEIGKAEGSCKAVVGPCTATATWDLSGHKLGAGVHSLTISAVSNATMETQSTEYTLDVHAASPLAMGPGSVNPANGDFALESTAADLKYGGGALRVAQHYDSENTTAGADGPLGSQWKIGLGSIASLEVMGPEGHEEGVMTIGPEGFVMFSLNSGHYEPAQGHAELTLTKTDEGHEFVLENSKKGYRTTFSRPVAQDNEWLPTIIEGPSKTNAITNIYRGVEVEAGKTVVEPTEELAPHGERSCPAEVAKMQKGCRALLFAYEDEHEVTKQAEAKGEKESEWGWYKGRLTQIAAATWNSTAEKMEAIPVAEFAYDGRGRLRAEWDPRIKPTLKTVYGYDEEEHVTSLTPPGQQPWAFVYGTTASDASTGRLLKVTRAHPEVGASEAQIAKRLSEEHEHLVSKERPSLSGTANVGRRLAVSSGTWEGRAVVYGYQWELCNASGGECSPIDGATNANYTLVLEDLHRTVRAKVTATNAGGSTAVSTLVSAEVGTEGWHGFVGHNETADSGTAINAVSCLPASSDCVLSDSKGNAKYATNVSSKAAATWSSWSGPGLSPSEAVDCPTSGLCLLAAGSSDEGAGNLYYATSLGGAWSEAYSPSYGVDAIACVSSSLCVNGLDGDGYLRASTKPASTSWSLTQQGSAKMNAGACLSSSFCVLADSTGRVHVAVSAAKIESGTWSETDVDGSIALKGVACVSKTSCMAVDGVGNVLLLAVNSETGAVTSTAKSDIDGSNALTAISCSGSICAAVDSKGNVFITTNGGSSWSKAWELGGDLTSVSCASSTLCLAAGTGGQVTAFNPSEEIKEEEGAQQTPQAGTTIEYNVPVEGTGAPYVMSHSEVEKWGQKDYPAEAAEVSPEEHPQGWPANGHTGATVYYMDDEADTVNIAASTGGISTTEYHEGDAVLALSADNRAQALKEAKPAEAASRLATVSKYGAEGNELTEVTGPEHKVKLSSGEEVNARNHVRYFYDEGAPLNGKGEVEEYGLVTKATDGALLANGEEKDVRTTLTGYSGEKGEGWTLREPTSTTTEPAGVDLVSSTKYNEETGAVEETRSPGGNAETVSPPVFASAFGKAGSGEGQFKEASAVAVGSPGEVFVDDRGDGRIEKFSSSGTFEGAFESKLGKFSGSWGMAVSPKTGDVLVADSGHNMIFVFSPAGEELRSFGSSGEGALSEPTGISVTPAGEVWVADYSANKVEEFSEEGKYLASVGEGHLKEPGDVSLDNGTLYVTSEHSVAMFTHHGEYVGSFGSHGTGPGQFDDPSEIVANPGTGDLFVVDGGNERVEEVNPAGKFLTEWGAPGSGNGEFAGVSGLAISATGTIYTSETSGDRVQAFTPAQAGAVLEVYSTQWGTDGSGHGEFLYTGEPAVTSSGNVLVTDNEADDVQEFTDQGKYIATYGSKGEGNGQMSGPTGLTVNQSTGEVLVAECANDRVQVLKAEGKYVREFGRGQLSCPGAVALDSSGDAWVADTDKNRVVEYSSTGALIATYGSVGTGHVQFNDPTDIKVLGSDVYVSDTRNDRVEILNLKGEWVGQIGSEGNGGGQFNHPEGIAFNSASDLFVLDSANNRIEEFNPEGHFLQSIATHGVSEGQLNAPQGIAVTPAGDIYVADAGNHRIEKWIPDSQAVHDTKSYDYVPGTERGVPAECQNRPEWEGLPCRTEHVAQPTDSAAEPTGEQLPELPVVTIQYNMWLQPDKTIETVGGKERVNTTSYEGERATGTSVSANSGEPVPAVTLKYSATQGALIEQSAGEAKIIRTLNTLGQLESYTDANGNGTTYSYDEYGRPVEINFDASKLDGLEAKQRLHYEQATGELTEMTDENGTGGAKTFKATYGPEGEMLTVVYPNNLTATYTYNAIGEGVGLNYLKSNHCSGSECEWFTDSLTPSIHGETMSQQSSLAIGRYRYEQPGRLAEVQETPAGEDCTAQIYGYNEEGQRTSLITRKSAGSECTASEGGEAVRHTYDEANRLTDEGVEYGRLGNITKLPAPDAGASTLETSYYADGQVYYQAQDGTANTYTLDPEGRTEMTETVTKELSSVAVVSHYAAPGGSTPSWTENRTAHTWSRGIMGFGGLVAVEESGKEAVLQLRDLQGNIVGTASLSETAGKPKTMERTTAFGVPISEKPADKYGFLGAEGVTSDLPSGTIVQDGATYVPQISSPIQAEGTPVPAPPVTVAPFPIVVSAPESFSGEEAHAKAGEGGVPEGNMPQPEGGEEGDGGCLTICDGLHALPKATPKFFGCSVWTKIEINEYWDDIYAWGNFKCNHKVKKFELEVCIQAKSVSGGGNFGTLICGSGDPYGSEYEPGTEWGKHQTFENTSHGKTGIEYICTQGLVYRAAVWAWMSEDEWMSAEEWVYSRELSLRIGGVCVNGPSGI